MMLRGCLGLGAGLLAFACSGRYDVGFEPTPAGSAGTTSSENKAGTAPVTTAGTASGSGASGSSSSAGGSAAAGGSDEPGSLSRCGFAPSGVAAPSAPASSAVLAARVYRFLDASEAPTDLMLPRTPSAEWAASLATQILDGHAASASEAPGLARFLAAWLPAAPDATELPAAHAWAKKLVSADATLATLLSEPTGEPHRFGIITEPDVLAARVGISARGDWLMKSLFCMDVPAAPPNLPPFEPTPPSGMTERQHLEASVSSPSCRACHNVFDPAGDSLEHFDAQGNYRTLDNGQPVDAAATIVTPVFEFEDFASLAPQLAVSCEVAQCVGGALLQNALSAALSTSDVVLPEAERNQVANAFANADFSLRALVQAIVTSPSFVR